METKSPIYAIILRVLPLIAISYFSAVGPNNLVDKHGPSDLEEYVYVALIYCNFTIWILVSFYTRITYKVALIFLSSILYVSCITLSLTTLQVFVDWSFMIMIPYALAYVVIFGLVSKSKFLILDFKQLFLCAGVFTLIFSVQQFWNYPGRSAIVHAIFVWQLSVGTYLTLIDYWHTRFYHTNALEVTAQE